MVVVFRSRLRADANLPALEALGARMYALASQMSGKDFSAADGESLTPVEFDCEANLQAWRDRHEHLAARERGRTEVFADDRITVCESQRADRFAVGEGRVPLP